MAAKPPRPVRLFAPPEPIEAYWLLPDAPPFRFTWRRRAYRGRRADGPERIAEEWWTEGVLAPAKSPSMRSAITTGSRMKRGGASGCSAPGCPARRRRAGSSMASLPGEQIANAGAAAEKAFDRLSRTIGDRQHRPAGQHPRADGHHRPSRPWPSNANSVRLTPNCRSPAISRSCAAPRTPTNW